MKDIIEFILFIVLIVGTIGMYYLVPEFIKYFFSMIPVTIHYLINLRKNNASHNFNKIRKEYEELDLITLKDQLIRYKINNSQSQQVLTGIILILFTALLGGFGQSICRWIRKLLILNLNINISKIKSMQNTDEKLVLNIEGIVVIIVILLIILGIYLFTNKMKENQKRILLLKEVIKAKKKEKKNNNER